MNFSGPDLLLCRANVSSSVHAVPELIVSFFTSDSSWNDICSAFLSVAVKELLKSYKQLR